jgi:putative FmdB family regulatory protein
VVCILLICLLREGTDSLEGEPPTMPAYDFRCNKCSKVFEVIRPMGATGDPDCPECGSAASKVFSPVGVAFKGTGFHNTDYKSRPKEDTGPCTSADSSPACAGCPAAATAE